MAHRSVLRALLLIFVAAISAACRGAISAPFTPPEAGGAPWVEVTSAHFDLCSDLDLPEARGAVEDLERMYETLLEVGFPYVAKPAQRIRVVFFRREEEYKLVAPFGTSGFFSRGVWLDGDGPEPVAVIFGNVTKKTRRVLQHELTHRFVGFYFPKAPAWLNEGLAHYFETLEVENGQTVLGRPAFAFRKGLSWIKGAIPTAEVLAAHDVLGISKAALDMDRSKAGTPSEELNENRHALAHRASAWALVHLLKNGPEPYRRVFDVFLRRLGEGASAGEAWSSALANVETSRLDADFAASLASLEITLLRTTYTPPPPSIESAREMPPAEVHLLWSVMKGKDAAAEIDAALRLAPESTTAWRMKARLHERKGAFAEAESALQKAAALSPADPRVTFDLFRLYALRAEFRGAPPQWKERAEALVPKLLPQASTSANVANTLAWNLGRWGRVDEALPLSLRSIQIEQGSWQSYDTLAMLLASKGAWAKAVEAQSLAVDLRPDGADDPAPFRRLREYRKALAAKAPAAEGPPEGQLSEAVIRIIVKRRQDGYQKCYADGLARDPRLAGKVGVRFVIAPDGVPVSPMDEGSTLPDREVVQCILREMAELRFPAREGSAAQSVGYPLVFSPPAPGL